MYLYYFLWKLLWMVTVAATEYPVLLKIAFIPACHMKQVNELQKVTIYLLETICRQQEVFQSLEQQLSSGPCGESRKCSPNQLISMWRKQEVELNQLITMWRKTVNELSVDGYPSRWGIYLYIFFWMTVVIVDDCRHKKNK